MKAAQWFAPRDIRLVEVEKPVPKPHEALIKVESVGICGSDLHYYLDGRIGSTVITRPIILGHEFGGIVECVGESADPSLIGKRVAVEPGIPCLKCEWCRTGHYNVCADLFFPGGPPYDGVLCEYTAFHADFCFPVPNDLGAVEAAMIEPLAVAVHTVELAQLKPGETAAILGLGPIGLLTAQVAQRAGAGLLIGSDRLDYRVAAGLHYGLDVAFNAGREDTVEAILDITHGRGVDAAFDTARSSDTPALACKVVRPAGRCVFTGISGEDYDPIPVGVARRKELTIRWCRRFRHDYPRAIEMAACGMVDVKSLVTHSFSLERTRDAFELVAANADNVLKASVDL
ncbi:MAG TPA: alcohol dehydrogenase catalytic domain-containing protein [Candidatus Hydrogenedentes bacterium]|nr:alcohol dehydrogenase catalytic domain-containing protein [Candidatus Hydrogenedentota bacterium]HPC15097.1 alcohol dehydrogenase catalytic domain-containing protein [Candidatus Hydrogenedentota bacterium]HRT19042.1 alcohol dehydrogenase catalytic domain-containing protein [Candidatus Hydrogenedentota bacterium]HRT63971.1 alcohol dehydrogenase catalytic domain-containing protein [Candidatus Hydrogenedentota bacterium]